MTTKTELSSHPASFRDRDGFLYELDGVLVRQVNQTYARHYDLLIESGLYDRLVRGGNLIRHQEIDEPGMIPEKAYKVIEPERVEFISYPYEWCFSQLKEAALATLKSQNQALELGMSLKDASAYNIQYRGDRPVLIDSLSFVRYESGRPWIAYRQFCQHFLAPLALMAYTDVRLGQLLRTYLDGVPLDLASRLLPWRTRLRGGLLIHIHIHASMQQRARRGGSDTSRQRGDMSRRGMLGIIDSLRRAIESLSWDPKQTDWSDYTDTHNYGETAFAQKRQAVQEFLAEVAPRKVWDLGANTGLFSRLASSRGIPTISFDLDPGAVELNYRQSRQDPDSNLLPLLLDLTNPSPSQGWALQERQSLIERGPADGVLALALIHHLAIGNNVPLVSVAEFLSKLGSHQLVEFVPKDDAQIQRMLANREDIFEDYSVKGFELAFYRYFDMRRRTPLGDSGRMLYWLDRRA